MSVCRGQGVKIVTTGSMYLLNRKEDAPGSVRRDQDLRALFTLLSARGTRPDPHIHAYIYLSVYPCMH